MPIEVTDLASLDQDAVADNLTEAVTRLSEENPTAALKGGPVQSLVLRPHAMLETQLEENTARLARSASLLEIEQDPTLADDDIVDRVFSNYRITRRTGSQATGTITVVVSKNTTVSVAEGAIWTANGQQFLSDRPYIAKSEASQVIGVNDRQLRELSNGSFAFTIDVIAVEEGAAGLISRDTAFVPTVFPANFVRAYAASDFTNGEDTETNQQLLTRLQEGIAAKALSGRTHMQAALRAVEDFAGVISTSIIGFGDPEMIRDQHSIFPVSYGGRVDWYVRTQLAAAKVTLTVTAVLVAVESAASSLWQFALGLDDAPGYYEVLNIRLPGETDDSFEIEEEIRSLDLTGDGFIPDLATVMEGVFSRYQAATVQFRDTETLTSGLTVGDTAEYDIELRLMPQIADIQDLFGDRDHRNAAGDVLVKAPIPCFVELSFTVRKRVGEDDPDLDAIQTALAEAINRTGFSGRLYASVLQDIIGGFLTANMAVSKIEMFGRILRPDLTNTFIDDTDTLEIPDLSAVLTTGNTVAFFCDAEDIAIDVETVQSLSV